MTASNNNPELTKAELKMLQLIRARVKNDIGFRELFLSDPDTALKEFSKFEKKTDCE